MFEVNFYPSYRFPNAGLDAVGRLLQFRVCPPVRRPSGAVKKSAKSPLVEQTAIRLQIGWGIGHLREHVTNSLAPTVKLVDGGPRRLAWENFLSSWFPLDHILSGMRRRSHLAKLWYSKEVLAEYAAYSTRVVSIDAHERIFLRSDRIGS